MTKKILWGIKISPKTIEFNKTPEIIYSITISKSKYAEKKEKELFITNELIQKLIKEKKIKEIEIGYLHAIINKNKKTILIANYFPFGESERIERILKGKGISTLIDLSILKNLKKHYSKYKVNLAADPILKGRLNQLRKRNIKANVFLPIEEVYEKTKRIYLSELRKIKKEIEIKKMSKIKYLEMIKAKRKKRKLIK